MPARKFEILVLFDPIATPCRVKGDSIFFEVSIAINDFLSLNHQRQKRKLIEKEEDGQTLFLIWYRK
jgi:hypothetical protein